MPKPIKLTAPALDALRPTGKREDYRFAKRAAPNLVLRSSAAGSLTWTYVAKVAGSNYRATFGPVRRLANGKVDPANVEEARAWAANQRAAVQSGVNVLQVQRAAKGVPTLGDVWEEFRAGRSRGKAASSQAADLLKWETYIRPELGQMKVDAIDRATVKGFLDRVYSQLLQHKQSTNGSRVNDIRALLSTLFTVAVQAGHVDVNPVQAVPAFKIAKRDRKPLTDAQRAALLSAAHSHSAEMGLIVLIALTTGLRRGNVLGMRWEYLDGSLLTFPASAMKGKRDHVVRLPETLQARLGEWRERNTCECGRPPWDARARRGVGIPFHRHETRQHAGTRAARPVQHKDSLGAYPGGGGPSRLHLPWATARLCHSRRKG